MLISMDIVFDGILFLCRQINENAQSASSNLSLCSDLARHAQGIEDILIGIQNEVISAESYPQCLRDQLQQLEHALGRANDIIQRYGKRGRILRYILATKVKTEFEGAFQQINLALQPLGAINIQINSECRRNINELSSQVLQINFSLSKEMETINKKFDELIKQKSLLDSPDEQLNSKVEEILEEIPGEHSQFEKFCDIEDLDKEMQIARAEKKSEEVFMIDQIISVLQEQARQPWCNEHAPQEIVCPITQQVMSDPVIVSQTGQTYERGAIEKWFEQGNHHDPVSKIEIVEHPILVRNYAIKGVIDSYNTTKQFYNFGDLEAGGTSKVQSKQWPLWLRVVINLVIICIMAVAIAFIVILSQEQGDGSSKTSTGQSLSDTAKELPVCSKATNPFECDMNVLREIHNRVDDPCTSERSSDIFCAQNNRVLKIARSYQTVPLQLSRLDGLQALDLKNDSALQGEHLPSQWSTLTNMLNFTAKGTNIAGSLPPEYSTWLNLRKFTAGGNFFNGIIPAQYSTWTNVENVGLRGSKLQGTLPPQLSTWSKIQKLYLFDSSLTGTLPPQLSTWYNTSIVRLHRNHFSGSVPPQYSNLNGELRVTNEEGFSNGNICVEKESLLVQKFNSEKGTGDLDQVPPC